MLITSLDFLHFSGAAAVYPGSYCCKNKYLYIINKNSFSLNQLN